MKTELLKLITLAAMGSMVAATAGATIAYDNAAVAPNQSFGNSLGLDFTVNQTIEVTSLGAFDSGNLANLIGADGASGVTVQIFNSAGVAQGVAVHFTPASLVNQVNGDAFLAITPLILSAGFSGSIVAYNDDNFNSSGAVNLTSAENTGGGLISFIGGARYNNTGPVSGNPPFIIYPTTVDTGPENRYDAGTFEFQAVPEASTYIAGALLLLPFGMSAMRSVNKKRA